MLRVATDVGGTFTDIVVWDEEAAGERALRCVKVDSTPPAFERGIVNGLQASGIDLKCVERLVHGSTVIINALTERRGALTALITTRGFRDVLEIGRANRPDLFNYRFEKRKPFVPRYLRCEITERLDSDGNVLAPLQLEELDEIIGSFRQASVEAIAICLLHAYVNPIHELALVSAIRSRWPEVHVVASHEVCREWREYERTSTAVLTAYVRPVAHEYLSRLQGQLDSLGIRSTFFVMQSNGGLDLVDAVRTAPISMIESGPAGGILGAAALGEAIGETELIALDIGGTTAKCSLIRGGRPRVITDYAIESSRLSPGYPIKTAVIDIVEIGNGGGSIAWIDPGGRLRVGPKSAGSMPGPAAYGRGGKDPTTTDANLLLGRINPSLFLGGAVPDMSEVRRAFETLDLGHEVDHLSKARGVIRIANGSMVNALKLVSVNRGYDPRDFALVAFGGGGGLHAAFLAEELQFRKVIVPRHASVFSAWGMLRANMRRDYLTTRLIRLSVDSGALVAQTFLDLERRALAGYFEDGLVNDSIVLERNAHMRYVGQQHTVEVQIEAGDGAELNVERIAENFHSAHERRFTFRLTNAVEFVAFHIVATALLPKANLAPLIKRPLHQSAPTMRRIDFDYYGILDAAIYDRDTLNVNDVINGPAAIDEADTATIVPPKWTVTVDGFGSLHMVATSGGQRCA